MSLHENYFSTVIALAKCMTKDFMIPINRWKDDDDFQLIDKNVLIDLAVTRDLLKS